MFANLGMRFKWLSILVEIMSVFFECVLFINNSWFIVLVLFWSSFCTNQSLVAVANVFVNSCSPPVTGVHS